MPMVPPAPGRFSTITGWPSAGESLSLMVRAMMSVALPGVKGTMTLTVPEGYPCARAVPRGDRINPTTAIAENIAFISSFLVSHRRRAPPRSLRLDAGSLDDAGVLGDFAAHEAGEFLRGHIHGVIAEAVESLAHAGIRERLACIAGNFSDDIGWRAGRRPNAEPQRRIRAGDPRFARGWNIRKLAVALRR